MTRNIFALPPGLRVIVTAGASGIGRAISDLLLDLGARVHICDIDFLEEFRAAHPQAGATRADVSSEADVAFVGIGNIGEHCPLHEDGFLTTDEVHELMRLGAIAEMLGLPIDANGRRVDSPTGRRVTSLHLDSPPKRPTIGFAGGVRKREALIAALKGGWLSGLVTDEACARAALGEAA